jgi:hypothetical protein
MCCEPTGQSAEVRPKTVIINYVHSSGIFSKFLPHLQPRVDYLKIPEFPDLILSGVQGDILLKVRTDGQKAISIDVMESVHPALAEMSIENVKTWYFKEHAPTEFTVRWKYVLGEADGTAKSDTATLNLPRNIEIVMFPRPDANSGASNSELNDPDNHCPNDLPQVEYLKIPEHPGQLRPAGFKNDVIMKVKTDGQSVISAEAIAFVNKVYRDSSIETIKAWRFKEHTPTEFTICWKYDAEFESVFTVKQSAFTPKPDIVTLTSNNKVEIKIFHLPEVDSVNIKKKLKKKK